MITHDVNEALMLADRLIVLEGNPAKIALDEKIALDKRSRKLSDPELVAVSDKFMSVAGLS